MRAEVLRLAAEALLLAFAQGDEEIARAVEHQPRAEMTGAGDLRLLGEDDGRIVKRRRILRQSGAQGGRTVSAAGVRLRKCQINQSIARKFRIDGDIEQPALATAVDLRHPFDGRSDLPILAD